MSTEQNDRGKRFTATSPFPSESGDGQAKAQRIVERVLSVVGLGVIFLYNNLVRRWQEACHGWTQMNADIVLVLEIN